MALKAIEVPEWWHSPDLDKLDRRTRKTREALYQALAALLQEKPLKSISVTELTRAADVNRSTFYIHFTDIYDMFDKMSHDFRSTVVHMAAEREEQLEGGKYRALLDDVYRYFHKNRKAFSIVFGQRGEDSTFGDVAVIIRGYWARHLATKCSVDEGTLGYKMEFAIRGAIGVCRTWIEGGCEEPVEDMVELTSQLIEAVRGLGLPEAADGGDKAS